MKFFEVFSFYLLCLLVAYLWPTCRRLVTYLWLTCGLLVAIRG